MPKPRPDLTAARAADRLAAERLLAGIDVSRETWVRLEESVALLDHWQATTNLVAPDTLPVVWTRHVADSLQLLPLIPDGAKTIVDLGSGGGFPAIPLACALAGRGTHIHLVESVNRKAAFLRDVIRRLALPATVHAVRIEDVDSTAIGTIDVVTARGLAPLDRLLGLAAPLFSAETVGLFMKGRDVGVELNDAARYWDFEHRSVPSMTDGNAAIVQIPGKPLPRTGETVR